MKKIFLICCMMAATNMLVFGQTTQQVTQVSKSKFTSKVSQLNKLLDQNNTVEAKALWDDVHNMMMAELDGIKGKVREAASTNNNAEKERWTNVMKSQFAIYSSVIKVRGNMVQNKATIKTKLNEFSAGIL